MKSSRVTYLAGASLLLFFTAVNAQYPGGGGFGNPFSSGVNNPFASAATTTLPTNPSSPSFNPITSSPIGNPYGSNQGDQRNGALPSNVSHILTIHAVLACLTWLFLVPTGGIILRLGFQSPWVVRIHAICQSLALSVYIIAACMGFWLARQFSQFEKIWSQPHPVLGVFILVFAIAQPLTGWIHHRRYKQKLEQVRNGGAKPGRSGLSRFHLFLGRALILAAIVNGALGIRGANQVQSAESNQKAHIIYAVLVGWMAVLYAGIVISFELRKRAKDRKERDGGFEPKLTREPPSYDESQEYLGHRTSFDERHEDERH